MTLVVWKTPFTAASIRSRRPWSQLRAKYILRAAFNPAGGLQVFQNLPWLGCAAGVPDALDGATWSAGTCDSTEPLFRHRLQWRVAV